MTKIFLLIYLWFNPIDPNYKSIIDMGPLTKLTFCDSDRVKIEAVLNKTEFKPRLNIICYDYPEIAVLYMSGDSFSGGVISNVTFVGGYNFYGEWQP